MPATTTVSLFPPQLPADACFDTYQDLANAIIGGAVAQFQSDIGNTYFNTGSSTPAAENRDYPWLDCDGNWWVYNGGYWVRKHPYQSADSVRLIWTGDTTALLTFDGGTNAAVTDFTGPMWEVDTAFEGKFPVGVGTFSVSGSVAVAQSTTNTGVTGEDRHSLTAAENPAHTHDLILDKVTVADTGGVLRFPNGDSQESVTPTTFTTEESGSGTSHNNLPPFYGVYFIKRTARIYYTSSSQAQGDCGCGTTATVYTGSGSPEGIVTAAIGSLYTDTTNDVIYIKTVDGGNTGWAQQV
jgi:hypothetical protein